MLTDFLKKHKIKEKRICVGVSGGSDSLALVLLANEELTPLGYKIIAITVNHGLRSCAQQEADYVAKTIHNLSVSAHLLYYRQIL